MSEYRPPEDIWEVNSLLQLDETLDGEDDPRWVDTEAARGDYSVRRVGRTLGVDACKEKLTPPERGYYLFCGHRGCGKSTELRRIRNDLHRPHRYYVVFADATHELDVNNLRYQDILLHLAGNLVAQLQQDSIHVDHMHLQQLEAWFTERVEKKDRTSALAVEAKAGLQGTVGLPLLAKMFAVMSGSIKTNSTYKTELRRTIQNHFTEFSEAFNHLIEAAEEAIGQRVLFVIDGTDRLSGDDARAFFVADVHQLQQVRGLFVYCAPIHLFYEAHDISQNFTALFRLPMVKIANEDDSRHHPGRDAMREMLYRRAAPELFDDGVADYLIEHSGGHPRDLLRLVLNAFKHADRDRFDEESARRAVREMAGDYRRLLDGDDYRTLASIDSHREIPPTSERVRNLLYNLALLEYNDLFWRSHPAIRNTQAYEAARQSIDDQHDG